MEIFIGIHYGRTMWKNLFWLANCCQVHSESRHPWFFFFWNHKVIICLNLSKMFSTTWKCCWSQTCCLDLWTRIIQLRFPWNSISLLENRRQSNSFKHSKSFKRLNWLHQTVESSFWFIGKRKAHGTFFGSRNEGEERF